MGPRGGKNAVGGADTFMSCWTSWFLSSRGFLRPGPNVERRKDL